LLNVGQVNGLLQDYNSNEIETFPLFHDFSPEIKSFDSDVINSVIITAHVIAEESKSLSNLVDPVIQIFKHVKQVRGCVTIHIVVLCKVSMIVIISQITI
jgi:hypothetical protein